MFDGRGIGNGRPLPAGPLRERADAIWPSEPDTPPRFILVNGRWPAPRERCFEAERALGGAVALADWSRGGPATREALHALRGRPVLAAAGIGDPERFFTMLEAEGLAIERLPLADHAAFDTLPWPAGTADAVVTEKDAVKLAPHDLGGTRVWVATLDFGLPPALAHALRETLAARRPAA